jgi:glycosyltransferase involved in cell wall biosynthesis
MSIPTSTLPVAANRAGPLSKVAVSVVVPVRNEARNIERCLRSVGWADEVFVVDSQSTDGTSAIAEALGATVVQFHYSGPWPKKKNWALDNIPFRNRWVLLLDADEVLPPEAEDEFRRVVTSGPEGVRGYWINRRFLFMGRWLKHAYYPNWNLRLFQHRFGRFGQMTSAETDSGDVEIHEHVTVDGPTGRLSCEMDHYAFPTVSAFVEKHNRYSSWEAHVALDPAATGGTGPSRMRSWIRRGTRHLPMRAFLRFLYVYVWQRGFLDGREGYYFARLHGYYEFLSVAKSCELRRSAERQHIE